MNAGSAQSIGYTPPTMHGFFYARGGAVLAGGVRALDFARTDAATTSAEPGARDSCYANAIAPTEAEIISGTMMVAADAAADDRAFRGIIKGRVQALVAGPLSAGANLVATTGETLAEPGTSGEKIVGRLLETIGSGTTLAWVEFDGHHGRGTHVA